VPPGRYIPGAALTCTGPAALDIVGGAPAMGVTEVAGVVVVAADIVAGGAPGAATVVASAVLVVPSP
jgi:hypothetical protein